MNEIIKKYLHRYRRTSAPAPPVGFTLVQAGYYASNSNPSTHVFNNASSVGGWLTPTKGNLLVFVVYADSVMSTTPIDGWFTPFATAVDFGAGYLFWKRSDGTESSITINLNSLASCIIFGYEFNGPTQIDQIATTIGQSSPINTGTTVFTTKGNEVVFVVAGQNLGGTATGTLSPWDNSFITFLTAKTTGVGTPLSCTVSYKIVSNCANFTANVPVSGTSGNNNSGIIATFK